MFNTKPLIAHVYDVVGALWEVHKELGPGLYEECYQEGLEMELTERNILFEREAVIHPMYHGVLMKKYYRVDFLCKKDIVVECKAVEQLCPDNRSQLFNYMRIKKANSGILVNFSPKTIQLERYFYDKEHDDIVNVYGQVVRSTRFLNDNI